MADDKKKKILIVEDDQFLLNIYTTVFEKENLQVLTSTSGEDGFKAAQTELPDIILLDIMLAGKMNGLDVLREMRQTDNPAKNIPVIIMSNLSDDETVSEGLKLGANGYCVKSQTDPSDIVRNVLTFVK